MDYNENDIEKALENQIPEAAENISGDGVHIDENEAKKKKKKKCC